jgi:hypothetical protein
MKEAYILLPIGLVCFCIVAVIQEIVLAAIVRHQRRVWRADGHGQLPASNRKQMETEGTGSE